MIYLQLFYEFFKTGLFAIGGGLATLPFLYDMSLRTGWFTAEEIASMIAISQSTPGPLGINMAAYTGYITGGMIGALVAPIGLVMPSLIIIVMIAKALERFQQSKIVKGIFYGLKPASLALIAAAWIGVLKITYHPEALILKDNSQGSFFRQGLILAAVLFFVLRKWKLHPILLVVSAALLGILFRF